MTHILLALLFIATPVFATTGFTFLEIPVGAREGALGGAGVALESGPTSATYNPAITAMADRSSVVLMTNQHFADTRTQFFGATLTARRFSFSPHYWGTRVPDIEFRETPTRDPISTFDAVNSALGASFAAKLLPKWSVGVTAHYLYQKIHVESSDGWAVDVGTFWHTPVKGLSLGAALNHLGRVSGFISEDEDLPTTFRGGATYVKPVRNIGSMLLTVEAAGINQNTPIFRGGVEFRAPQFVALRAGYVEGLDAQSVSLGFGLFHRGIRLDYAFIPFEENLGEGHRFSLGLDL